VTMQSCVLFFTQPSSWRPSREQGTLGMGFNKRDDKIVVASLPPSLPAQVPIPIPLP